MIPDSSDSVERDDAHLEEIALRREISVAAHLGHSNLALAHLGDIRPDVRTTALWGLANAGALTNDQLSTALKDTNASVRRTACELAARMPEPPLTVLLDDAEPLVAEMAAWALGERDDASDEIVSALSRVTSEHSDPLVRESAVAALGALGAGLPAILSACKDKPAIRRRAVLALAPFEGPQVEDALRAALQDSDRQVRQAAEDVLGETAEN